MERNYHKTYFIRRGQGSRLACVVTAIIQLCVCYIAGIQESSSAFSRFGSLQDGEEAGNSVHSSTGRSTTVAAENSSSYSLRGKSSVSGSGGGGGGGGAESSSSSGGRKKTTAKKSKPQLERVSFEECVRQVSDKLEASM